MSDEQINKRLDDIFSDLDIPDPHPDPTAKTDDAKRTAARLPAVQPVIEATTPTDVPGKTPSGGPDNKLEQVSRKPALPPPAGDQISEAPSRWFAWPGWRLIFWLGIILLAAAVLLVVYGQALFSTWRQSGSVEQPAIVLPLTRTPTATPLASATPTVEISAFAFPEPTAVPTPGPGGQNTILNPGPRAAGWVVSGEENPISASAAPNHFGDSFLYAGSLDGEHYYAALQFDLSQIPRGAAIHSASLRLTGLRAELLNPQENGTWQLQLLAPELDHFWTNVDYQQIHRVPVLASIAPPLAQTDLQPGEVNEFQFTSEQLALLEQRILQSNDQFGAKVSFRIDGPTGDTNNLFAWDNSEANGGGGARPELFISTGPAPEKPPPPYYILVTSTPTPVNIQTAAANALRVTAEAVRVGTATPPPPVWVTPLIVTSTPLPENRATAEVMRQEATAIALTTGEPLPNVAVATPTPTYVMITSTPTPENIATAAAHSARLTVEATRRGTATPLPANWVTPVVVTATPTPENEATAEYRQAAVLITGTPTPLPPNAATATASPTYVMITSTPTPENIGTAVANSLRLTAVARRVGTPTPLPANWVTPFVVTATPTPENQATAEYWQAALLTTGTPTPLPVNIQTATPTPVFDLIEPILTPTPTLVPSPTPQAMPAVLVGKVLFLSDREGATTEEPDVYVYDPETDQLGRLTDIWPYKAALVRDTWSADKRFRVFTKDATRFDGATTPALFYADTLYGTEEQLTQFGAGIAYGGAWSPTAEQIAFVSNDSSDDEIWIIDRDQDNLKQLTSSNESFNAREIGKDTFIPEISKHPSWSLDGQQIVFYSNRTGNNQLWIMNSDGSNERLLMAWNPYNDWDPVWIKYTDPAPPLDYEPE